MWAREGVSRKKRRVICARGFCSSVASLCVLYSRSRSQRRGDPSSSSAVTVRAGGWTTTADMFLRRGRASALGLKSLKLQQQHLGWSLVTAARWQANTGELVLSFSSRKTFWGGGEAGGVILTAAVRQLIAGWHLFTQVRKPGKQCTTKNWIVKLCVQTLYYRCYFKSRSKHTFTLIC